MEMRHSNFNVAASLKEQPRGYSYTTAVYDHFQVIFISAGELHFTTPAVHRVLSAGDILVLRQDSRFRLHCPQQGYHGVCFNALGAVPSAFRGEAVAGAAQRNVRELADMMLREIAIPAAGTSDILHGLGLALAWQAVRQFTAGEPDADAADAWTERVRQAIHATLTTGRGVREILAVLPLSYRQLTRHFKGQTGLSPKQYQQQARLAEVQRLLRDTRLSVTTIAFELGYPSSQHLSQLFRKYTGTTPAEYRRLLE